MKSGQYAYEHRRLRKRDFRKLWIRRISAACKLEGISYSKFMYGMKLANVALNRKMLSEIAGTNPDQFHNLVEMANKAIASETK